LQPLVEGHANGNPRPLTDGPGRAAVPNFSADGELVAFYRIIEQRRELWIVPTRGGAEVQLTDGTPCDINPAFSPDGRCLSFTRNDPGGSRISVLEVTSHGAKGPPHPVAEPPGFVTFSAWSPAGDHLAYLADGDVWIVPAPECPAVGTPIRHGTRLTIGADARDLAWVDDGAALLVSGTWGGERIELRQVPVDNPTAVSETILVIGDPRGEGTFGVSRDGRFVSTIATDTRGDIWVARVVAP